MEMVGKDIRIQEITKYVTKYKGKIMKEEKELIKCKTVATPVFTGEHETNTHEINTTYFQKYILSMR